MPLEGWVGLRAGEEGFGGLVGGEECSCWCGVSIMGKMGRPVGE